MLSNVIALEGFHPTYVPALSKYDILPEGVSFPEVADGVGLAAVVGVHVQHLQGACYHCVPVHASLPGLEHCTGGKREGQGSL